MKRLLVTVTTLAGLALSLPAAAQFQKPEDAVKYRKAAMTVMANHFGHIGAMANGKAPYDAAQAAANAEIVATMSKLPFVGYVEGTAGQFVKHQVHGASGRHGRCNPNYFIVFFGQFNKCFTKNILELWGLIYRTIARKNLARIFVKYSRGVVFCLIYFGKFKTFAFLSNNME